jgi:CubicO group peptidase (beta-lactamase class C family)
MHYVCTLILATGIIAGVSAQDGPSEVQAHLDSLLREQAIRHTLVGASFSLLDIRQPQVYLSHFGYSSLSSAKAVDSQTLFKIGSCTKAMTAMAVMQLVERGVVRLDIPITDYLPELQFRKPAGMADITIHHLLCHTSGLRSEIENGSFTSNREESCYASDLQGDTLLVPPGHIWSYSNLGYGLLGCLIERLSGLSYGDYLRANLFEPAGMLHTRLFEELQTSEQLLQGYWADSSVYVEPGLRDLAAGDVVSTISDMNRFMEIFLRGGRINGHQILSPESLEMMMQNQVAGTALSTSDEYGYGLFVLNMETVSDTIIGPLAAHKGDTRVFHSAFLVAPRIGLATAVLTNSEHGDAITNSMMLAGMEYYLKHQKGIDISAANYDGFCPEALVYSPLTNTQVVGEYDLGVGGMVRVKATGKKRLKWKTDFRSPSVILNQVEAGLYKVKVVLFKVLPIKVKSLRVFFEEVDGQVYLKQMSEGDCSVDYTGKLRKRLYSGNAWESYVGDYEVLNLEPGVALMAPVAIRTYHGMVYLKVRDTMSTVTQELTFEPVSDSLAVHNFVGRGIGDYLKVLDNGNLYYSGFEIRKK